MTQLRITRTSQPQGAVGIDWGNPITAGLVVAFAPSVSGSNLIAGDPTKANAKANTVGAKGRSSTFNGLVSTSPALATTKWSFLTLFKTASAIDSQECILGRGSLSSNNTGFGFNSSHATASYAGAIYAGLGYTVIGKPTGGALTANTEYCIAGTYDGTNGRGYSNGIRTVGPTAVASINLGTRFAVNDNSDASGGVDVSAANVYITLVYNRALSDAEIRSISENPWQIFQPTSRAIYVGEGAAGGSLSLTTDVGILTLAGYAPTVTQTNSTTLTPDAGTVTLTGNIPTVAQTANQSVTAGVGTLAIQGYAPSVNQSASGTLNPGVGSITITGNEPTVTQTAHQAVTPSVGSVSIQGYAPTVTTQVNVTPDVGSLTVNGYAPTIQQTAHQVIVPGFGAFTVDGWVPTVTRTADTATVARPATDTSNTGWTANGAATLSACLNEVTPSAAEYISASSVGAVCQLAMNPTVYPGTASQVLKYRASSSTGNSVIVRLKNAGGSTIRTATQPLTATDTEYSITLTSGEIASIASGSLSVELESA